MVPMSLNLDDPERTHGLKMALERMGDIAPGSINFVIAQDRAHMTAVVAPKGAPFRTVRVSINAAAWNDKANDELAGTLYSLAEQEYERVIAVDAPRPEDRFPEFSKELRARAQERAKELLWGAPTDDPRVLAVRLTFKDAAAAVFLAAPEGRRRAVAMTHLEEALMWATKAVFEQE